jgi:hydroxymethylcytosylglucuronate/cytosylglucuronate synthase
LFVSGFSQLQPIEPEFSLLAAPRQIGWGPVGKLRLILERLPSAKVTVYGDENTVARVKRFLGPQHKFDVHPPPRFDVALVINDPTTANRIADMDVPVVYLESLPYLYRRDSDLPQIAKFACYCAQKYHQPVGSPMLQERDDITWVDPIVPVPTSRRGGEGIVINVGGLYIYNVDDLPADLVNDGVEAYLKLVLFPLVDLLQRSNRKISAICGNLNADACSRLREIVPAGVSVGPQSPHAFEFSLRDADLLITAPGSTTILQAMSINLPTLLLPSLNRSQHYNAKVFSKPHADVMQWPDSVVDTAQFEALRAEGSRGVNRYLFESIIGAAASRELSNEVSSTIRKAVCNAPDDGVLNYSLSAVGIAGADQVAEMVKQVALRHQQIVEM